MQPFTRHRGLAAPLMRRDIDTDQIIPKQFLKSIERTGFGRHLFHDWRTRPDGSANADFVLDQPRYAGTSVLITGANFGCGSSREHAAWALADYGVRAIIAPSFADIFRANAVTNGLLPLVLTEGAVSALAAAATIEEGYRVEIDLMECRVSDGGAVDVRFDIDAASRDRLLRGLDDIDIILQHQAAIAAYERARHPFPSHS